MIAYSIERRINMKDSLNNNTSKKKTKNNPRLKTITQMFKNYSQDDIQKAFNSLNKQEKNLLIKAFGQNLDSLDNYSNLTKNEKTKASQIKQKMKKILANINSQEDEKRNKTAEEKNLLTDSSINDMLRKIDYKPLTRKEEIRFIKKARLSFYNSASEEEQKILLEDYKDVFPIFRKKYDEADDKEKEKLIKSEIKNSIYWRNKFLENNQKLVIFIAKKNKHKASLEELLIE